MTLERKTIHIIMRIISSYPPVLMDMGLSEQRPMKDGNLFKVDKGIWKIFYLYVLKIRFITWCHKILPVTSFSLEDSFVELYIRKRPVQASYPSLVSQGHCIGNSLRRQSALKLKVGPSKCGSWKVFHACCDSEWGHVSLGLAFCYSSLPCFFNLQGK